jgi:hypothetical protein
MSNIKKFILILCLLSCKESKRNETKQSIDPLAAKFRLIENKLNEFAGRHNAKVETAWYFRGNPAYTYTETGPFRRIVWADSTFSKAIIIEPYRDTTGVDSTAWDFLYVAWLDTTVGENPLHNPTYTKNLLKKVKFEVIEKNIDQLLSTSEKELQKIKREDLE